MFFFFKNRPPPGFTRTDPLFPVTALFRSGVLVNVPKSRIFGIDTDLTGRPTRDLTLTGAVTYLDTRIREYTGYDGVPTIVDFAGSDLPFAPRWNYSVDANFRPPIGDNGKAILGPTVYGQSRQDTVESGRASRRERACRL